MLLWKQKHYYYYYYEPYMVTECNVYASNMGLKRDRQRDRDDIKKEKL